MEEYIEWRSKYIKRYKKTDMVYVLYDEYKYKNTDGRITNYLTISEAHGYGMLLAVYNDDKDTYMCLLKFYLSMLNKNGLMKRFVLLDCNNDIKDGSVATCNKTSSDMDIVYSLLIAYERWGDIDFKIHGLNGLNSIYNYNMNKDRYVPLLSDDTISKDTIARPSDFVLLYFEKFKKYHIIDSQFWSRVISTCVSIISDFSNMKIGLISDYITYKNGTWYRPNGKIVETKNDMNYFYNSCRLPWRLSEYYLSMIVNQKSRVFSKRKSRIQSNIELVGGILKKYSDFFTKEIKKHDYIRVGYTLEGNQINKMYDLAFTGPVYIMYKVMFLLNKNVKERVVMDKLYNKIQIIKNNYYGDTIFLVGKYSIEYHHTNKLRAEFNEYTEMMSNIERYTNNLSGILNNVYNRRNEKNGKMRTIYQDADIKFDNIDNEESIMTKLKIQYGIIEIQGIGKIECYLNGDIGGVCLPIIYKMDILDTSIMNTYTLDWHEYQIRFFINKYLVYTMDNNDYKNPMHIILSGDFSSIISKMLIYEYKKQI